jgi:hypothetical protein
MKHRSHFLNAVAGILLLSTFSAAHAVGGIKTTPNLKQASVLKLHADLDGAAALPGNSEAASGEVIATYDRSTHVLRFYAHFVGLSGQATNARFHGPAAFDRAAGATVAAPRPEARLVEGSAWLDREQELDLLAGRWYFNVTTEKHPAGEIRGMVHIQNPASQ